MVPLLQNATGHEGAKQTAFFSCFLTHNFVLDQVIAKRNIQAGEEITAAYGKKYATALRKSAQAHRKKCEKLESERIQELKKFVTIVKAANSNIEKIFCKKCKKLLKHSDWRRHVRWCKEKKRHLLQRAGAKPNPPSFFTFAESLTCFPLG